MTAVKTPKNTIPHTRIYNSKGNQENPESRDKMKLILKDLGLPFYDPIMIIEKTEGRMEEDDFWIRIER